MEVTYSEPYHWTDENDGRHTGRMMLVDGEPIQLPAKLNTGFHIIVQVQPSYAGTPVFVERRKLRRYPESPIPEPTK